MIELPWPPKALSPNHRSKNHWARTRALKQARADGYHATKDAKVGVAAGDVPIAIQATFHPPVRRNRDRDNLAASLKAYLDGIADALGVDDHLFRPQPPIIGEPVKGGKVVICIGSNTGEG